MTTGGNPEADPWRLQDQPIHPQSAVREGAGYLISQRVCRTAAWCHKPWLRGNRLGLQVLNWLQFGTTPVGVADGAMPYEKAGVLRARGILKDLPERRSEVPCTHC